MGTKQIRQAKNLEIDEWNPVAAQLMSYKAEILHDENARRADPLAGIGVAQEPVPIVDAPPEIDMDDQPPIKARLCCLSFVLGCLLWRLLGFLGAVSLCVFCASTLNVSVGSVCVFCCLV